MRRALPVPVTAALLGTALALLAATLVTVPLVPVTAKSAVPTFTTGSANVTRNTRESALVGLVEGV